MVNILNNDLKVWFLEGIGDIENTIDIRDANETGVFCKIQNANSPESQLDKSKLSFVIYYNDVLLTEGIEYKFDFTTENEEQFISVIYNSKNFTNWNNSNIRCYINYEATLFSNVLKENDAEKFMQASTLIYEVPVSQPLFKSNSTIVYIEDSLYNINNNKDKYTYISKINTSTGYNLFGVKRKEFFSQIPVSDPEILKEQININADVVKLTPSTTQVQIYSFKNGPQYMELSTEALNQGLANNGKILPHYFQSYEYKIDGTIPKNKVNDYNIRFYGSNGYVSSGNISAHIDGIDNVFSQLYSTITLEEEHDTLLNYLSYSFTVPYTYTAETNETILTYSKIRNQSQIIRKPDSAVVSENTYTPVNNYYNNINAELLRTYSDALEIFERKIEYVRLSNSLFTANDIIANPSNYYRYNSRTFTYVNLVGATDVDLSEIYTQCVSYNKIASNLNTTVKNVNSQYDDTNIVKYIQLYDYKLVDKDNAEPKSLFYIPKEILNGKNAYYPIQNGIVNDGSIEYYGYTYIRLTEDQIREFKSRQSNECPKIYVRQEYSKVSPTELFTLTENDLKNNLYISDTVIYKEYLSNTEIIFDFDINDNQVYATNKTIDGVERTVPLDREELENIYYNSNDWFTKNRQEETSTNRISNYSLPSNFNIVAKVDYNGHFDKIDYSKLDNVNIQLNEYCTNERLFIKKPSYNEVNNYDLVYGYDAEFYVYGIGKISPAAINDIKDIYVDATKYVSDTSEFTHPFYLIGDNKVYYDDTIWIGTIDNNGFIDHLDYYTRTPIKTLTNDLYLFNNKEYYSETEHVNVSQTMHGTTPLFPLAYLGVTNGTTVYSIFNYWKQLNNEDPLYTNYIKLRNNTAKLFYSSCYSYLSYSTKDSEEKHSVTNGTSKLENTSSYYLKINTYSGNNYLDIKNIVQNDYELCINLAEYSSGYIFDWDNIKYYKDSISHYLMSSYYNLVTDIEEYDKKYLYSKYFYQEFTNNNGVHQAKDGSYYTTISIFDGTRGTISKSLFLQPNIFNVTEYTYNYTTYAFIEIDLDENLNSIPQSEYSKYYYIGQNENYGQFINLTPESKSPAYYQSFLATYNDSRLYMYVEKEMTAKYDGRNVGPINDLQVQYFDNVTYAPKIIKKNEDFFGIIFNVDLTDVNDQNIIQPDTNLFVSPINYVNRPYEYDIVKLKEYIENDSTSNENVILQSQTTEYKNVTTPTPFYLANEKEAIFTGTYVWNLPKHAYVFAKNNDQYTSYEILKEDGYWERKYDIHTIPLVIASYNFYSDPSKISNTTLSYTFTPDSTIVSEVIIHPEISYKSIVKESKEVARFKYMYQGVEHDYPSNSHVQENDDGTYYGIINIDGKNFLVNLVKYIDIDFVNTLQDVVHQEYDVTYKYFSYKNSVALCNEKVPVLYNTELVPATSHKILYWNEDASSYAIRTVVDSYAHYAYNYYFDIVPFVTTSYMRQDSEFTITYLSDIYSTLTTMSNGIYDSVSKVSQNVSYVPPVINELTDTLNNIGNSTNSKLGYLESLSNNITNALYTLQNGIAGSDRDIIIDVDGITQVIGYQTDALSSYLNGIEPKLFDINNTIDTSLDSIKNDIIETIQDVFRYESESITYVLREGLKKKGLPTYEEFMIDLTKTMYAKIDFDKEIVDTEQRDENGNMVNKSKHKANPTDLAKKTIYRADILWQELKKKNIVS